ncbi:MAG: Asp-tRNA(Asn)/Glu-tRNA(Gln) amidotransferase subunit GatB [Candidatus Kaiserbacteria bacterium]|nr:Asp-tRNA(Asn)/Glu-tRNA(Gln) amidotransferase subunit GatB [Candidatus Kaiserbacteria bacterium]
MKTYTPTIGLEVHAELLTESKLFCGCRNDPNSDDPNMFICPICVGYPGALPYMNKQAVEHMLRIGVALGGELASFTEFDRKHYFYPDIPKGYQISQYAFPLVKHASLNKVGIERIHLEEDTAKSAHDVCSRGSVIDFNRSGVPLMELVTEPVIHSAEEARAFGDILQQTLRYLGVARARMEWGEMRVEANISVSKTDTLGTKVEVKNLNSFKAVSGAIEYEIERQTALLEQGEQIAQETRGWNENTGKTFSQRSKETSAEYRYMPEPDLPKYYIDRMPEWDAESLRATLPELPERRMERYTEELKLDAKKADVLVKNKPLGDLFDGVLQTVEHADAIRLTANYLSSDVMQYVEEGNDTLFERLTADALAEVIQMLIDGELSSRGAKEVIAVLVKEGGAARGIAERQGLFQESDESALQEVITKVVAGNEAAVAEYKAGKEQALQFLVGQVMKETRGSANPTKAQELLKEALK